MRVRQASTDQCPAAGQQIISQGQAQRLIRSLSLVLSRHVLRNGAERRRRPKSWQIDCLQIKVHWEVQERKGKVSERRKQRAKERRMGRLCSQLPFLLRRSLRRRGAGGKVCWRVNTAKRKGCVEAAKWSARTQSASAMFSPHPTREWRSEPRQPSRAAPKAELTR